MSAEIIASYGPFVVGAVLLTPLVLCLASMLLEIRPGKRWPRLRPRAR